MMEAILKVMQSYIKAVIFLLIFIGQLVQPQNTVRDADFDVNYIVANINVQKGNNPMLGYPVWGLSFGANCTVDSLEVSFDNYPISAPLDSSVTFWILVQGCSSKGTPSGSGHNVEKVSVDWQFTPLSNNIPAFDMKNTSDHFDCQSPKSLNCQGDITIQMPPYIGVYDLELTFKIKSKNHGSQTSVINRKVYVTYRKPLAYLGFPDYSFYDFACNWASGQSTDVTGIIKAVLPNIYRYGSEHWKYTAIYSTPCNDWIDQNPGVQGQSWANLLDPGNPCNSGVCYTFSDVLHNICAVLGVDGFTPVSVYGNGNAYGFVTQFNHPSLDPAFPGNVAACSDTAIYVAYCFGDHSLLEMNGQYFDATFNQIYSSEREFILWDFNELVKYPPPVHNSTIQEGTTQAGPDIIRTQIGIYRAYPNSFAYWPGYCYYDSSSSAEIAMGKPEQALANIPAASAQKLSAGFTGSVEFSPALSENKFIAGNLSAGIEVEVKQAGSYMITGEIQKGGQTVAITPAWKSSVVFTAAHIQEQPGTYHTSLNFSGEEIFRAGLDGPYTLKAVLHSTKGLEDTLTVQTPAYKHSDFGEVGLSLSDVTTEKVKTGKRDKIRASLTVNVRMADQYRIQGTILRGTEALSSEGHIIELSGGKQSVTLDLPVSKNGQQNYRMKRYLVINIFDDNMHHLTGKKKLLP